MVARAGTGLSNVWLVDGAAWWLESRPAEAGRVVLMRASEAREKSERTTLMPRIFLPTVWPFLWTRWMVMPTKISQAMTAMPIPTPLNAFM